MMHEKWRWLLAQIVDANSERVVGAHMIGPDSAEILQGQSS